MELKHIAPYLPHGVHLMNDFGNLHNTTLNKSISIYEMLEMKLILRPLSDLTKEIEHNGKKLIPYTELDKIKKDVEFYRPINFNSPIELLINTGDYSQEIDLYDGYLIIQKLLEWHFDIFGLIESGKAIDINTLK